MAQPQTQQPQPSKEYLEELKRQARDPRNGWYHESSGKSYRGTQTYLWQVHGGVKSGRIRTFVGEFLHWSRGYTAHHGIRMTYQDFLDENLERYNLIKSTGDWIWSLSEEQVFDLARERKIDFAAKSLNQIKEMLTSSIAAEKLERREKKKENGKT